MLDETEDVLSGRSMGLCHRKVLVEEAEGGTKLS